MSFHIDKATGARHLHLAWSRIARREDGRLYALDPGLYKLKLKELSRALEQELGLRIVSNDRAPDAKTRAADRNEFEEARRLGTDLKRIRNTIFDCLHCSENGAGFNAALDMAGLMLAQGDRRDCFVVVDQAGGHHALNKKLTGLTLADIRQRLCDLDRPQLPSVDQAQRMQRARLAVRNRNGRHLENFGCAGKPRGRPYSGGKHGGGKILPAQATTPITDHARGPWNELAGWTTRRRSSAPADPWRRCRKFLRNSSECVRPQLVSRASGRVSHSR